MKHISYYHSNSSFSVSSAIPAKSIIANIFALVVCAYLTAIQRLQIQYQALNHFFNEQFLYIS